MKQEDVQHRQEDVQHRQEDVQHQQEDVQHQDEQAIPAKVIDDEATLTQVSGSAFGGSHALTGVFMGVGAYGGMKVAGTVS